MSHIGGCDRDYWHPILLKQLVEQATKAGRFETFLARTFGVKRTGQDHRTRVTMYYWRGRYYLTDQQELPE